MNIKKRIEAFTLSELLVVLLLTAVVVGLAFSILTLVQRQMLGIQQTLEDGTRFRQLHQQLALDVNSYNAIRFYQEDSTLVFTSPMDSLSYQFEGSNLIRQSDTFDIGLNTLKLFYRGLDATSDKVDAIKISTLKNNYPRDIFLFKWTDSKTRLD